MSLQVFLEAHLRGSERFLSAPAASSPSSLEFIGRAAWLSLLSDVLPRALLAEMKLSRMLLGSSGGEQFLLVLTDESIVQANEFLAKAAAAISELTGGLLDLVWANTENLGSWPIVRHRLDESLQRRIGAAGTAPDFTPFAQPETRISADYFVALAGSLAAATAIGWSPEQPAILLADSGTHSWPLVEPGTPLDATDSLSFPRRTASNPESKPVEPRDLARKSDGAARWGMLRGDIDGFTLRLKRANSVEDLIQTSILYKEFLAGELTLLCAAPEFWQKCSILRSGGNDFVVLGAWDALIALAREFQRVFEKFVEGNLKQAAGLDGKTMTMALVIAPRRDSSLASAFEQAGVSLQSTKVGEPGAFYVFGRTLEWKRLADAEELKNGLVRLVKRYGYSSSRIQDIAAVYREAYSPQASRKNKAIRVDKPWRTYMRLSRIMPPSRQRELSQLRSTVIGNLIGTKTATAKIRPSGRVGLEWARLATERR